MQKNVLKKLFISYKRDLALGAVLLLTALCLFLIFRSFKTQSGGTVVVEQEGRIVGTYSLSEDGQYEFQTFYGSNTLIIENQEAYVIDATCKDRICEKMGPISKKGEMIICIPNGLFIRIIDGEEGAYDAVVQ